MFVTELFTFDLTSMHWLWGQVQHARLKELRCCLDRHYLRASSPLLWICWDFGDDKTWQDSNIIFWKNCRLGGNVSQIAVTFWDGVFFPCLLGTYWPSLCWQCKKLAYQVAAPNSKKKKHETYILFIQRRVNRISIYYTYRVFIQGQLFHSSKILQGRSLAKSTAYRCASWVGGPSNGSLKSGWSIIMVIRCQVSLPDNVGCTNCLVMLGVVLG